MHTQGVARDDAHPCALQKARFHFTLPVRPLLYPSRMRLPIRITVLFGGGRARDLNFGKWSIQHFLKGPQLPCRYCKPEMYTNCALTRS